MMRITGLPHACRPWSIIVVLALTVGCTETPRTGDLVGPKRSHVAIAAAANLKFVFDRMEEEFERERDLDLRITYGSSGSLYAQLSNKAPFDIFFSADTNYPKSLAREGWAEKDSFKVYAEGRLVIWGLSESDVRPEKEQMQCLTDRSVRKIAIANPELAPYGRAAVEAMNHFDVYTSVKDHLVFGENITQTAQYAESGSAELAIIAKSIALCDRLQSTGTYWTIPDDAHKPIQQGVVILEHAKNQSGAKQFYDFVLSPAGQRVFQEFGYGSPNCGKTVPSAEDSD